MLRPHDALLQSFLASPSISGSVRTSKGRPSFVTETSMKHSPSKFLVFHNGGCCRPHTIATINIAATGVAILSSNGEMICFIPADSDAVKRRVAAAIRDCCDEGKKFVQPDWVALGVEVSE